MRLLSFLSLVQSQLGLRRPECPGGWTRRANYQEGTACFSHPQLGLTLTVRDCLLADGQHNLNATWHGVTGEVLNSRSFFSGSPGFQWEAAAGTVTELMPAPALQERATTPATAELPTRQLITA